MTGKKRKQWASDVLGDMEAALHRKKRQYNRYLRHGAAGAAERAAAEIESMERELERERELFDLAFN